MILPSMPKVRKYLRFTLSAIIPLQREEEEEGKLKEKKEKRAESYMAEGG